MPIKIKRASGPKPWTKGYKFKARTDTTEYEFEIVSEETQIAVRTDARSRPWFVEADKKHVRLAATSVRAIII